jgi:hypothetical protein
LVAQLNWRFEQVGIAHVKFERDRLNRHAVPPAKRNRAGQRVVLEIDDVVGQRRAT